MYNLQGKTGGLYLLSILLCLAVGMGCVPAKEEQQASVAKRNQKLSESQRPLLPKWKTKAEINTHRLLEKAPGKEGGLPQRISADQYDDYRNNNFDKFFITKAPTAKVRPVAEYEASQRYMLAWPMNLGAARNSVYLSLIKNLWGVVPVVLVYEHAAHRQFLENQLTTNGIAVADLTDPTKVIWYKHQVDSLWIRDYGPISVVGTAGSTYSFNPHLSFVDARYFHTRAHDDEMPADLANLWGINDYRPDIELEGGNFMSTEEGLCVVSKVVLWNNLQLNQATIETIFKDYYGCKKIIFITPLKGEPSGHIDMFAKFAPDNTVLVGQYTADQDQDNKDILDFNAALLANTTSPSGKTLTVIRVPMPSNLGGSTGKVWRTYVNSLAVQNDTQKFILIPVYSDSNTNEDGALASYTSAFPGWTQVKIDAKDIIEWGGALHCIALNIPQAALSSLENAPADLCGKVNWSCTPLDCGEVKAQGCCDDQVLKYCDNGKLRMNDCATNMQCGWEQYANIYSCGTLGGSDPAGTHQKNCDVITDSGVKDASKHDARVGDGTMGSDGTTTSDGGGDTGCGHIPNIGCCEGQMLKYCVQNHISQIDCSDRLSCGWSAQSEWYDCSTSGQAEPTGKAPRNCASYIKVDSGISNKDAGSLMPDAGSVISIDSGTPQAIQKEVPSGLNCQVGSAVSLEGLGSWLMIVVGLHLIHRRRRH